MRIAGAFEENEARGCKSVAPSMRNAVSLMPMKPGALRRTHLRGHANIYKRLCIHGGAFNLGLLLRKLIGRGTPRGFHRLAKVFGAGADGLKSTFEFFSRRRPLFEAFSLSISELVSIYGNIAPRVRLNGKTYPAICILPIFRYIRFFNRLLRAVGAGAHFQDGVPFSLADDQEVIRRHMAY